MPRLLAGLLASLGDCPVDFAALDGTRQGDIEALLRRVRELAARMEVPPEAPPAGAG